ncbi:UNVERIFIED_CONTAM: putative metal-nicotianamine transporter YSL9 [Sesamum calycinum]|uniref:Metal-nicotianamine transporter YSL9 n=1 Tax=Sesamum calycinum TaxID=2727403 RepID=A0AAW2LRW6_9LAMI
MIIDYKLRYPSGTATAVLINGFHTTKGDKMAKKQVRGFMKFCSLSFIWSFFQWFYSGGEQCGFVNFPTFGLKAGNNRMICSHLVNLSLLLGAVLSWGVMWPLIGAKKGDWFSESIKESSMKSLNGYKVMVSKFIKTILFTVRSMYHAFNKKNLKAAEMYYVLVAYILAPSLSFCNAYGAGLTDMNMAYNYGKVALFVLAALTGNDNGVVAGLIGCGLIKSLSPYPLT